MTPKHSAPIKTKKALNKDGSQIDHPDDERKPAPEKLLLPSHDEARTLCNLAAEIKALSPWQWLQETDLFGVEDPDTGEIGFVSVMGSVGEFESVAVYRGPEGIFAFIDFQNDPSASADRLLEIPEVQLSFVEPTFLEKRDRELLKASGLKLTGARPQFRSFRPGYMPWFITLEEARLLIHALSQTVEMTKRLAEAPFLFPDDGDGETEPFLFRVPHKQDTSRKQGQPPEDHSRIENTESLRTSSPADVVWVDQIKRISRPPVRPVETSIDWKLVSDLKSIRLGTNQLEADLFIGPGRIGRPNERPLALYILMLADRFSGFILGFEALSGERSLATMYAGIPEKVAGLLWQNKVLPKQIIVRSELLLALLEPLEKELKIQLRHAAELPAIDEATASLIQWLQTGKI